MQVPRERAAGRFRIEEWRLISSFHTATPKAGTRRDASC